MKNEKLASKAILDGEELWRVVETNKDVIGYSHYYIGGVCYSPSGAVYAAGYIEQDNPLTTYGWVIKITPDGCVDTLCTTTSIMDQINTKKKVEVYPNPAVDNIVVEFVDDFHQHSLLECYNTTGTLLLRKELQPGKELISIDGWAPGPIFYKISSQGEMIKSGTIIKL